MSQIRENNSPSPENGCSQSGVKIRKRNRHPFRNEERFIYTKKVDKVMRCLRAMMDEASAGNISEQGIGLTRDFILDTNALLELRYHCERPADIKINPQVFAPDGVVPPNHILHQLINGETIGNILFGAGWESKIEHKE